MSQTVTAVFDGTVFHPESPLDLEPNARYVIIVAAKAEQEQKGDAWDTLEEMIGTVEAPADWSIEHDHYLYGTPKRYSGGEE